MWFRVWYHSGMNESPEQVLVIESDWVHSLHADRGFIAQINLEFLRELPARAFFMDRSDAESKPQYRQVIPYVLVRNEGMYLTVTRLKTQGESRLHDKMSFGIGGHINPVDGEAETLLDRGLRRELSEELATDNPPGYNDLPIIGIILSDSNEVSRVHIGIVMRWDVAEKVDIRETDKMQGKYMYPGEIGDVYDRLENWSALVYDGLFRTESARKA